MVERFGMTLMLAGCLVAAPGLFARQAGSAQEQQNQQDKNQDKNQKQGNPFPADTNNVPVMPSHEGQPAQQPSQNQQKPNPNPQGQNQQGKGNPFPTDTTNVPLMPSNAAPDVPAGSPSDEGTSYSLPSTDSDPVPSPDGADAASSNGFESSSNIKSLDSILPPPDDEEPTGKHGKNRRDAMEGPPTESSKQDIDVGNYYLDNKNWKAALSRFQSALVLAPDEPDVYWGLAESERHLGNYASAKANYLKVIEYDPDSKHAKEATKALKEPEIANAKVPTGAQTPP